MMDYSLCILTDFRPSLAYWVYRVGPTERNGARAGYVAPLVFNT